MSVHPRMLGRTPYFKAMTKRYAFRNDQWERTKNLVPERQGHICVTARDNRLFVEACCTAIGQASPTGFA